VAGRRLATGIEAPLKYGGSVSRDAASGETILRYTDASGSAHIVHFQDRSAVNAKTAWTKTKQPQIAGMAIWVVGGEDPGFWPDIAAQLGRP